VGLFLFISEKEMTGWSEVFHRRQTPDDFAGIAKYSRADHGYRKAYFDVGHAPKDQSNQRKYQPGYAAWEIHPVMKLTVQ